MGLGGYLMWTAVAREIVKASKIPGTKVLPIETNGSQYLKVVMNDIFRYNPHIAYNVSQAHGKDFYCIPMVLNNPQTNYCKKDTPEKAYHRYDKHVIEQICESYGISSPQLKCELYFSLEDEADADMLLRTIKGDAFHNGFIAIEPNVKNEYGVNKEYPLKKWEEIVRQFPEEMFVQIGVENSPLINADNVYDLRGKTSFKTAALIIQASKFFLGPEGGLMHAANAVDKKSIIIITGFLHPHMTCYPTNTNIWIGSDHGPCGMKIKCNQCEKNAQEHDITEVTTAIKKMLQERL